MTRPARHVASDGALGERVHGRAERAVAYTRQRALVAGIALLDIRSGELVTAGAAETLFPAASVAKVLIAARRLLIGSLDATESAQCDAMIRRSDNDAAWALYDRVGADDLLPWLEQHYGLSIGAPPTMPGIWGSTQLTATGMVRLYAALRGHPAVWPSLGAAMRAYEPCAPDGEPNDFGIAAAAPGSAVKNGWATDRDVTAPTNAILNSTGLVQDDRYAVAILAEGPGRLYYQPGQDALTGAARILLPAGRVA